METEGYYGLTPNRSFDSLTTTTNHQLVLSTCFPFTMGNDDLITDDYVAEMLAEEAKDCSLKYSTMGMEAYTSSSSSSSRCATPPYALPNANLCPAR